MAGRSGAAGKALSSVRLFEGAEPVESGNDARDRKLVETVGGDHDFGLRSPGTPDSGVGRAKQHDYRQAESSRHVSGSAIVPDEEHCAGKHGFHAGERTAEYIVFAKERSVV